MSRRKREELAGQVGSLLTDLERDHSSPQIRAFASEVRAGKWTRSELEEIRHNIFQARATAEEQAQAEGATREVGGGLMFQQSAVNGRLENFGNDAERAEADILQNEIPGVMQAISSPDPAMQEWGLKRANEIGDEQQGLIQRNQQRIDDEVEGDADLLEARRDNTLKYINERTKRLDPIADGRQRLQKVQNALTSGSPAAVGASILSLAAYLNEGRPTDKDAEAVSQYGNLLERWYQKYVTAIQGEGPMSPVITDLGKLLAELEKVDTARAQNVIAELDARVDFEGAYVNKDFYNAGFDRGFFTESNFDYEEVAQAADNPPPPPGDDGLSLTEAGSTGVIGAGVGAAAGAARDAFRELTGDAAADAAVAGRRDNTLTDVAALAEGVDRESNASLRARAQAEHAAAVTKDSVAGMAARLARSSTRGAAKGALVGLFAGTGIDLALQALGAEASEETVGQVLQEGLWDVEIRHAARRYGEDSERVRVLIAERDASLERQEVRRARTRPGRAPTN